MGRRKPKESVRDRKGLAVRCIRRDGKAFFRKRRRWLRARMTDGGLIKLGAGRFARKVHPRECAFVR